MQTRRGIRADPDASVQNQIYRVLVSASLSPEDIRAAAHTHVELGPEYRDAVVESFIERVGREIDVRVDQRLAASPQLRKLREPHHLALGITSIALGIPLSAITLGLSSDNQLSALAIIWIAIAVINVAYALGVRSPR